MQINPRAHLVLNDIANGMLVINCSDWWVGGGKLLGQIEDCGTITSSEVQPDIVAAVIKAFRIEITAAN